MTTEDKIKERIYKRREGKHRRALNFRIFNRVFMGIIIILCLIVAANFIFLEKEFSDCVKSSNLYTIVSKAAIDMQDGSDFLTDEVRYFVVSREIYHMNNYFTERNITQRREKAVQALKSIDELERATYYLESALTESKNLEELEIYAMRLVVDGLHIKDTEDYKIPQEIKDVVLLQEDASLTDEYKISKAWLLLFSKQYITQKSIISSYKSLALSEIFKYSNNVYETSLLNLRHIYWSIQLVIFGIFLSGLLFFLCVTSHIIRPLYKLIKNIEKGEKLSYTPTQELNILCATYNEIFRKYSANEILLKHKAEHDQLTGLINRTAFDEIINTLSDSNEKIAFILVDVDFFKEVNDTYGHKIGDEVLKHVATSLSNNFRTTDYIGRIGGDEFTVIMTGLDNDKMKTKALIRNKMAELRERIKNHPEGLPEITLSIGISLGNNGYSKDLYENADFALYKVKKAGRDGFEIFEREQK